MNMDKLFISSSALDTEKIGEKLAKQLPSKSVVALFGELGMGKTAFVRGMARGLSIDDRVSSPTFAIVHDYGTKNHLYHFDMYRIETYEDLLSCGFFDYTDSEGITAVEWSENIENVLPENHIRVEISKGDTDDERKIRISGDGLDENSFN